MNKINNLILDIDGTLTNGKITYDQLGNEYKTFDVKDGMGINFIVKQGVRVIAITGRQSSINEKRLNELGVNEIFQNVKDKVQKINELQVNVEHALYIGDDINDYNAMTICGYGACPADAVEEIKSIADYISTKDAGAGAVRDILENYWKIKFEKGVKQ